MMLHRVLILKRHRDKRNSREELKSHSHKSSVYQNNAFDAKKLIDNEMWELSQENAQK